MLTFFERAAKAARRGIPVGASVDIATMSRDKDDRRPFQGGLGGVGGMAAVRAAQDATAAREAAGVERTELPTDTLIEWVTGALTWYDHKISTPITDGVQSMLRGATAQIKGIGDRGDAGEIISLPLTVPLSPIFAGIEQVMPGDQSEFEAEFNASFELERRMSEKGVGSSIAQTANELMHLGERGNVFNEDGTITLPLLDEEERWAERQAYYGSGVRKYVTGFADMGLAVALDPGTWVGGGVGAARTAATKLTAEGIEAAAKSSRISRRGVTALQGETRVAGGSEGALKPGPVTRQIEGETVDETGAAVEVFDEAVAEAADYGPHVAVQGALDDTAPAIRRLSPEWRLKNQTERLTDYAYEKFRELPDDANFVAEIAKDPILGQSTESGAAADLLRFVAQTVDDEEIAKDLMDQVQYAAMGDRVALQRIGEHSKRLQLDVERMMQPDDLAAREFIESSPVLTPEQKLDILNDEELFVRQADYIRERYEKAISDFSRVDQGGSVLGSTNVGGLGAAVDVTSVPLSAGWKRSWRGVGDARVTRMVQAFKSLPPVQFISGKNIPETIDLLDDAAPEIIDDYMMDMQKVLKPGGGSGSQRWNQRMRDEGADWSDVDNGVFRAEFTSTRGQMDPGLARSQRQNVLYRHNQAMRGALASKWAKAHGVDRNEVLAWIRAAEGVREKEVNHFMTHARRAVDTNSPLVYRSGDGTLLAASPEVSKAISVAQTQQRVALIDWKKMDRMLEKDFVPDQAFKEGGMNAWAISEAGLRVVTDTWKFAALFRPAYPVRVQMDTQLRRLATADVQELLLGIQHGIPQGIMRAIFNRKRVARADLDLFERKVRDYEELQFVRQEMDYTLAKHGPGKRLDDLHLREQQLRAALAMTPDQYRAELKRAGKEVDESKTSVGRTTMKRIGGSSRRYDEKTGEFTPGAWDDPYRGGAAERDRKMFPGAQDSAMGLLMSAHGKAMWRRQAIQYPLIEYGTNARAHARWTKGVIESVNHHIRNDQVMMKMARGDSPENIVKWMRSTPEGREYFRALNGNKGGEAKWHSEWDLVNAQREHFDLLVPNRRAMDVVAARKIDETDVDSWWQGDDIRPSVPASMAQALEDTKVNHAVTFYQHTRERYFHFASVLPEAIMGRSPIYRRFYKKHIHRLVNSTGMKGDRLTSEQLNQFTKRADMLARKDMGRIMFDTSHKSNMAYHMRFLSPFYAAWEDTMRKWATIFAENPAAVPIGYRTFEGLTSMGVVEDNEGNRIMPDGTVRAVNADGSLGEVVRETSNPNEGRFVFQAPKVWGVGGQKMSFSRGSLNAVFQGENPFIPGGGPLVSITANEMAKTGIPALADNADNPLVKEFLLPYGTTDETIAEQAMPAWMKAARTALYGANGSYTSQSMRTYPMLMQDELHRQAQEGEFLSKEETLEIVKKKNQAYWILRLGGTAVVPMSTAPGSELDWARREFRRYRDQYGAEAERVFIEDFPQFVEATYSLSFNDTGIAATEAANAEARKWRTEIAANPEIGWMMVGPENYVGGFSDAAYTVQMVQSISGATTQKFRSRREPQEMFDEIQVERGWREYSAFRTDLDLAMEQDGLKSLYSEDARELREIRDQFIKDLGRQNPAWAKAYESGSSTGRNPVGDTLVSAAGVLVRNPERVKGRDDLRALQDYLAFREEMRAALAERGVSTGFSSATAVEENEDLYDIWTSFTSELIAQSPQFEQLYIRARLEDDNLNSEVGVDVPVSEP